MVSSEGPSVLRVAATSRPYRAVGNASGLVQGTLEDVGIGTHGREKLVTARIGCAPRILPTPVDCTRYECVPRQTSIPGTELGLLGTRLICHLSWRLVCVSTVSVQVLRILRAAVFGEKTASTPGVHPFVPGSPTSDNVALFPWTCPKNALCCRANSAPARKSGFHSRIDVLHTV